MIHLIMGKVFLLYFTLYIVAANDVKRFYKVSMVSEIIFLKLERVHIEIEYCFE